MIDNRKFILKLKIKSENTSNTFRNEISNNIVKYYQFIFLIFLEVVPIEKL